MNPNHVIVGLLLFIAIRELFHIYTTHQLLNKLMSRNYHEFQVSTQVGKPVKEEAFPPVEIEQEDFGALSNIG